MFALCGAGFIVSATGIARALIYPHLAFNSNTVLMSAQGLGNMASALFLASFLKTRQRAPRLHWLIMALAVFAMSGAFSFFLPHSITLLIVALGVLFGPTILFAITFYLALKGSRDARTLLVGWTLMQAGTVWIFLRALDVVPYTEINHYTLPFAATFTALLSVGL